MLGSFFRHLLNPLKAPKLPARSQQRPRLQFEFLEDRVVPATLSVPSSLYPTIQSALSAAHAGDFVTVHPGTYIEQLSIGAGKDGLVLENSSYRSGWIATGTNQVIVQAPATLTGAAAVLDISFSTFVDIEGLTIVGNDQTHAGIRVDNGGNALIKYNTVTGVTAPDGAAILVGRSLSSDATTGTATIEYNIVSDYDKAGIVVDNSGSRADVEHNTITGDGSPTGTVQYGIQISYGAGADVENNSISGNASSTSDGFESGGILVLATTARGTKVDRNTLTGNFDGIFVTADTNDPVPGATAKIEVMYNASVSNLGDGIMIVDAHNTVTVANRISGNQRDGISVYGGHNQSPYATPADGDNNQIVGNYSLNNTHDGIYLWNTNNNQVFFNTCSGNSNNGVEFFQANNTFFVSNQMYYNGVDGFYASGSSNNIIRTNQISYNKLDGISLNNGSNQNQVFLNRVTTNGGHGIAIDGTSQHNALFGNWDLGNQAGN